MGYSSTLRVFQVGSLALILGLSSGLLSTTRVHAQTLASGFAESLVMGGWTEPVGVTWDANGRAYVWEKRGMVWIIQNGVRLPAPLIDISAEVGNWRDHGYLGFSLDPNFLVNGRIYMMYAVDRHHLMNFGTGAYSAGTNEYYAATIMRITRYTAIGPNFNTVDYNSRYVLLGETRQTGIPMTHESHSTGSLMFGQDGTLIATTGDGASYSSTDVGSAGETYWSQALTDSMIRPQENVGAMRSQMVNSHNGKILRMDPNTGDGVPSNPWYDATAPRAPRSRVYGLGLRNPFRSTMKPNSGSSNPADARPGTIFIGDVQWGTWEDLNVCFEAGQNFGWPVFEGLTPHSGYSTSQVQNQDTPNPLYDGITCTQQYFRFIDLVKQDSPVHLNGHPNPCNASVQIPNTVPKHFHERPAIDFAHGNQSRCGAFVGNTAVTYDLDDPNSPVPGPRFGGYAALAGPWSAGTNFPVGYQDCSYHADYVSGWIRRFKFDANDQPVSVHDFASGLGNLTWLGLGPDDCIWYIRYNTSEIRRICASSAVNLPPVAAAQQSVQYGPGPLNVNFTSTGCSDPENQTITYLWNFGDGTPTTNAQSPSHTFTAPASPTTYNVTLTVTDNIGQQTTANLIVSVNNTPPQVNITSIPADGYYPVGIDTTYQLQASVTDLEHAPAQLTYAWRTVFHHNTHNHPEAINSNVSTSTVISGVGCDGNEYYYMIHLTVTDAGGLSTHVQRRLDPRCYAIAPTALINASVSAGASPLLVVFDGTASYDPGGIVSYFWDFGDGTNSASNMPSKIFSEYGDHQVTLTVTDADGLTSTATKTISVLSFAAPQCVGAAGSILREYWSGIAGSTVADLTNNASYPNNPTSSNFLSSFQGPTNLANSYGTRVRGYIIAPQTGNYVFTATSDDASVVYLSLNADPIYKQVICSVPGWTNETEYTKYAAQTSAAVTLQAGVYYYVEMLQKEGSGGDHLALRWQTPSNNTRTIIPGTALARWQNCSPSVRTRTYLQGAWDTSLNLMRDDLRVAGLIPSTEPFTSLGFAQAGGGGGETVSAAHLAQTGTNAVVDWVLVELRSSANPAMILATKSALLERDGDIVGTDSYPRLLFNVASGNYHVAVRHRNHLGQLSLSPIALSASEVAVDFTSGSTNTWGTDARATLPNGRRAQWSGNVINDGYLRYVGAANDRDPILSQCGGSIPTATTTGYLPSDVNMDGVVRYVGMNNDRDPILINVGGSIPTNTRQQQLP